METCQNDVMAKKKANRPTSLPASGGDGRSDQTDQVLDFEDTLAEIERIVVRLEGGELGLTESLEQYESAIGKLKQCHRMLETAERKITVLAGFDADGTPVTEPFDELPDDSLDEKQQARSRRRSSGPAGDRRAQPDGRDDDPGRSSSVDDSPGLF